MKLAILTLAVCVSLTGAAWAVGEELPDLASPVPEPGSMALLLTGIGVGTAVFLRRRK